MKQIIKLLKRPRRKFRPYIRKHVYDICVVLKSSHGSRVYEKIGTYSLSNSKLKLNIFRLIFWFSKNVSMSGNVVKLFFKTNIFTPTCIINNN